MKRKYLAVNLGFLLILIILAFFAVIKKSSGLKYFIGTPIVKNEFQDMSVYFQVSNESVAWLMRRTEYCFVLTIENRSGKELNNCILTFDGRFRANIKELRVNSHVYGKTNIPARTMIVFHISSDTGNPGFFRDENDNILSLQAVPKTFSLQASEGYGEWALVDRK